MIAKIESGTITYLLAEHINGFAEQSGVLFLLIENKMASLTNNYSHPEFSN